MASHSANLWVLLGLGLAGILLVTRKFKKAIREDFGAFVQKLQLLPPPQPAPPKAPHPLTGLTFTVSDVYALCHLFSLVPFLFISRKKQEGKLIICMYVDYICEPLMLFVLFLVIKGTLTTLLTLFLYLAAKDRNNQ